jgi:A/G-specific adenine glycosylase
MRKPAPDTHLPEQLLHWYDNQGRTLPWRIRPEDRAAGKVPDPYAVWLSEIMCQQTRIATVIPYHAKFLAKWPKVENLAVASRDEIYQQWAGLGYYARARNLHACAQAVNEAGGFPETEAGWLALPGIGPYTAAAMMAIVHGHPCNVVDGNVERVISRLFAVQTPMPKAKPELKALAAKLVRKERAADYPQALMDLGALVCTPTSPSCPQCPWSKNCAALASGDPARFPVRLQKPKRPEKYGTAFLLTDGNRVLLQKRPEKGLLGGMSEPPNTPWRESTWKQSEAIKHAPCPGSWQKAGDVRHVFTHFALNVEVLHCEVPTGFNPVQGWWAELSRLDEEALPSLMQKVNKTNF